MVARLTVLAAALAASPAAWAATSNVEVYGYTQYDGGSASFTVITYSGPATAVLLSGTFSSAATLDTNFFDSTYAPQVDVALVGTAQIRGTDYLASARTTLGGNHALTSASSLPSRDRKSVV